MMPPTRTKTRRTKLVPVTEPWNGSIITEPRKERTAAHQSKQGRNGTHVMVHSFVDHPLRTEAIMAIVAFSCALCEQLSISKRCSARKQFVSLSCKTGRRDVLRR